MVILFTRRQSPLNLKSACNHWRFQNAFACAHTYFARVYACRQPFRRGLYGQNKAATALSQKLRPECPPLSYKAGTGKTDINTDTVFRERSPPAAADK